jgi:transcription elongation factor GreB
MSVPNYITQRGLDRITRELQWLQKVERPRITAEVAYAASLGDRSENAEYIYGKKRLREIDRRLRYLMKRLDKIQVVDPAAQASRAGDKVVFGATVVVEDEEGREKTWRIYGEDEVNVGRGVLSWRSPIARALLGRTAGDEVSFRTPKGERTVELLEVRYEAQEPLPDGLEAWKDA